MPKFLLMRIFTTDKDNYVKYLITIDIRISLHLKNLEKKIIRSKGQELDLNLAMK